FSSPNMLDRLLRVSGECHLRGAGGSVPLIVDLHGGTGSVLAYQRDQLARLLQRYPLDAGHDVARLEAPVGGRPAGGDRGDLDAAVGILVRGRELRADHGAAGVPAVDDVLG